MELPVQFDNIHRRVVDDLREKLTAASSLSIAVASFSIYAFEALRAGVKQVVITRADAILSGGTRIVR